MAALRTAWLALVAGGLVGAAGLARAAPEAFAIDPEQTHVHWEVRHFGTSTIRGRFDAITGGITLDRAAHTGNASFTIATASVSSGFAPFDGVVRGAYLLATDANPSAYFVANRFVFDGDNVASVTGEFTLRGVSQGLTLKALRFSCRTDAAPAREVCGGDFEGEIDRSAFGMSYGLPFVSSRVRLLIQIEAQRVGAPPP
ncbi:MAG TPA: YceI family protein [Burkholderiaceae bacterium]|jgi:polyisoprenoid-binding protein YceI